jgi:hypothetical protein
MSRNVVVTTVVVAILVGLAGLAWVGTRLGPTACENRFSPARCQVMTGYAAEKLGVSPAEITAMLVLPDPTAEVRDGVTILNTRSGVGPVETRVTLSDGSRHRVSMDCMGIPAIQCRDNPELQASSTTQGGYFDTPCGGEPPTGCASPPPSPDPQALAAAVELYVPELEIPITRDGHYEVPVVGEAQLPNGLLSDAGFGFATPGWPTDFTIAGGVVQIQVRSLDDPSRDFSNIHLHGWYPGVERVQAVLVFDVVHHDEGAVLSVRDIVVR